MKIKELVKKVVEAHNGMGACALTLEGEDAFGKMGERRLVDTSRGGLEVLNGNEVVGKGVGAVLWRARHRREFRRDGGVVWTAYDPSVGGTRLGLAVFVPAKVADRMEKRGFESVGALVGVEHGEEESQ